MPNDTTGNIDDILHTFFQMVRQCHSTLSLTVIDCHPLLICTVTLLPLLPFFVEMTVTLGYSPRR
jgi:hypothetical protein